MARKKGEKISCMKKKGSQQGEKKKEIRRSLPWGEKGRGKKEVDQIMPRGRST